MPKQRNKFLTVVFSLIPGAGHMFMGFMKTGLSLMTMFFLVIFLATWLHIGPLIYIIPILVFYSFFDCINKGFASPEEFAKFQDYYVFSQGLLSGMDGILKRKGRLMAGIIAILFGLYLFFENLADNDSLYQFHPRLYSTMRIVLDQFPQFVISFVIIVIGLFLIIGKKRSDDDNA